MIVFDASTLILLAKIELLDRLLRSFSLPVAVPAEVARECCGAKKVLDTLVIQRAIDDSRIRVVAIPNPAMVRKLRTDFSLGQGEAEAIALSAREDALLAIDDKSGINACKFLGVAFTTAIALLLRSREKELLSCDEALLRLEQLARHGRYKEAIIEDAKRRLEETR
jgi:predicted nucleic acid-binding protein